MADGTRAGDAVSGTSATTLVVDASGRVTQTHPMVPVGCACSVVTDRDGCVPEYETPIGLVVPSAAYKALRARSWRWRIRNWWAIRGLR